MQIGRDLGFANLDCENVNECIDSHSNELDDETLLEMEQQRVYQAEEDGDDAVVDMAVKEFTFGEISTFLQKIDDYSDFLANVDPNFERSCKVRQGLITSSNVIESYSKRQRKKRMVQRTLKDYFIKK